MKILQLQSSGAKKFGSKKVQAKKNKKGEENGQLNLFSAGRVLRLHPPSPFEEAMMMDEKGDYKAAKELYLKAVQADDSPADAYCNLGIMECQEGKYAKAIDYLTLCLKHNPRHYEGHFNLGNVYAEAGNLELAKMHYQVSAEIEPGFSNAYFNLGLTLAMNREYTEATEILNEYLRINPGAELKPVVELIQKFRDMAGTDPKC